MKGLILAGYLALLLAANYGEHPFDGNVNSIYQQANIFLSDTANFVVKKILIDTVWVGQAKNYNLIIKEIGQAVPIINRLNQVDFKVENFSAGGILTLSEKKLKIRGQVICYESTSSEIILFSVGKYSFFPGVAFLRIKFHQQGKLIQHSIYFYLRPKSDFLNLTLKLLNAKIRQRANQIFYLALKSIKFISQQKIDQAAGNADKA